MRIKNFLSLGAGVQSSTLALMAEHGQILHPETEFACSECFSYARGMADLCAYCGSARVVATSVLKEFDDLPPFVRQPEKPDAGIFADTKAEPASVYRWLDWLEKQLSFPIYRVSYGDLANDSMILRRSKKSGKVYARSFIPLFVKSFDGSQPRGIMPRKCTRDYKVHAINRQVRQLLGVRAFTKKMGVRAISWIGISRDEAIRMKPSLVPAIENRWPLIEMGITRQGCKDWMAKHGYPEPPRSACVFCPYHSDSEWMRLRDEEPEEFAKAIKWEREYQAICSQDEVIRGVPFLHDSLIPLSQVTFDGKKQFNLFGNECEGMCGV